MTGVYPRLRPHGDSAIAVEFGDTIDADTNRRVIELEHAVQTSNLPGVLECVPTYCSLLVHLDPLTAEHVTLSATLVRLAHEACAGAHVRAGKGRLWRVPVTYGGDHGEDLETLAARRGLSPKRVVELHVRPVYRVYMVGFMPGFTYLGGLDPRLATPRRRTPRSSVPGGSVSIGARQSAIGSVSGPSGWNLIGRTPVRCFHPRRDPVFLFEAGDTIVFEPISAAQWDRLDSQSAAGETVAKCECR
ncbi:MAG: 5-oxoprolinase subunit PxpB [Paracoccaceae bacterium]|nr:5-oxoprolinase subunit PxpB [Paracoccaceae bacterium]